MRDLDRIREVREYRVSGPQAMTFLVSALLLVGSVFVVGYQFGRLGAPADADLLAPLGSAEQSDPGAVLAEMMARRNSEAALSAAARPVSRVGDRLTASDDTTPAVPGLVASDVASLHEDAEITQAEPEGSDLPATDAEEAVPDLREVPGGTDAVAVVELVERSAPEPTPEPAPEPTPEPDLPPESLAVQAVSPLPLPPTGKGYTVQVGAYETEEEAAAAVGVLQARGLPVFLVTAVVNGKTWHRVRVGLHSTRESAEASATQLAGATAFPPYVTTQP